MFEEGLQLLVGQAVCAVVYDKDIKAKSLTSLQGRTQGLAAFRVLGIGPGGATAEVEILDSDTVCSGALRLFVEAPAASGGDHDDDDDDDDDDDEDDDDDHDDHDHNDDRKDGRR